MPYLITSALPYINGIKHLGNLVGSMLPADVCAKFLKQHGEEVLFICGTDEHGTPAELAAQAAGVSVKEYCADLYEQQKKIYEAFSIEFDFFGRSSAPSNHVLTAEIFSALEANNLIEEQAIQQFYSYDDQRFLPDRYVIGTCPHCGFDKARGDQCDQCGKLLDPTELIHPRSAISASENIKIKETKHLFFRLDQLSHSLRDWLAQHTDWPEVVKGVAKKWLAEGLKSRCITRDLKWGVKVPKSGYEDKVFYVWFDAPNAYISITQDWAATQADPACWKKWWLPEKSVDVTYLQFMAKDNVPFHAIFWPGMLMGAKQPWKLVDYIKGFDWLTYEGGKFSTSQQRGIFLDTALELFPADYWRYYLMSICPESGDSSFDFQRFAAVINKDLADVLGNFASRSLALIQKYFDNKVPMVLNAETLNNTLHQKCSELVKEIYAAFKDLKFRQAVSLIRALWSLGNEYIATEKPWEAIKSDPAKAAIILTHCVYLLRLYALVSYPLIPTTAKKILHLLNDPCAGMLSATHFEAGLNFFYYPKDHTVEPHTILFSKIPTEKALELAELFAGRKISVKKLM